MLNKILYEVDNRYSYVITALCFIHRHNKFHPLVWQFFLIGNKFVDV